MITIENQFYIRYILVLIKGGTEIIRKIVQRGLDREHIAVHDLLKQNKSAIIQSDQISRNQKLLDLLYPPSPNVTDISQWDISLLSFICLHYQRNTINATECKAIQKLKEHRNDISHNGAASIDMATYVALSGELNVIVSTLIHGMPDEDRDYFNQLITHASSAQLDMNGAITELKLRTEDICETVRTSIHDLEEALQNSHMEVTNMISHCHRDVLENRRLLVESMTQFKKDIEDILTGDSYKKVINTMFGALRVSADEQFTIATAENLLLSASKSSAEKAAPPEHMQAVKEKVDAFFEDLERLGIQANCVEKGSVLIEFTCPLDAVTAFIDYFCNERIEARMADIARCLEAVIRKRIFIIAYIPQQIMNNTLKKLRDNAEDSRGLKLTMTCTGVDGLVHVWDVFEEGAASNSLNELSKTLSEVMGKPVSLELSIDVEQMKKALQSTKEHIDISKQTDETEANDKTRAITTAEERLTHEQIRHLTIEDVCDYLALLNLHKYVEIFSTSRIDGELLPCLDEEIMIKDLKLRKFEAIKLQKFAREGRLPATRKPYHDVYITDLKEPYSVEVTKIERQDKELKTYQQEIKREQVQPQIHRASIQHNKTPDDLKNNYPDQLYQKQEKTEDKLNTVSKENRDLFMASARAREFETFKGRKFQVRNFYDQFKTCLPKFAMIVQGVRGNSNEDTFDQGQVVVIVSRTHKTFNPKQQLEGGSEYVEAYLITEDDKVGESISLPLDLPDLLIAEVTGIKGLNKEQWKRYQLDIRSQLTSAKKFKELHGPHQTDEIDFGDEYESCRSTIRSRTKNKRRSKFPFREMKKPPIAPKPLRKATSVDSQVNKERNIVPAKPHCENDIPRQNVPPILKKPEQKDHNQGNEYETLQSVSHYQSRNTHEGNQMYENKTTFIAKSKSMDYSLDVDVYENCSFEMNSESMYGNVPIHQQRHLRSTLSEDKDSFNKQYVKVYATEASTPVVQENKNLRLPAMPVVQEDENKYPRLPESSDAGNRLTSERVKQLTIEDVSDYLELLNLQKYVDIFSENQIDGELLSSLDEDILNKEFKMTKYEAIKLRNFAKEGRVPASRNLSIS